MANLRKMLSNPRRSSRLQPVVAAVATSTATTSAAATALSVSLPHTPPELRTAYTTGTAPPTNVITWYSVVDGLREGSSLSPTLFNVFIDLFLHRIRQLGLGAAVRLRSGARIWAGALAYADDIVLLADSPEELQQLLDAFGGSKTDARRRRPMPDA